ncbi:MAG TPA: threonine synthase, partial [Bacillota bacterium]
MAVTRLGLIERYREWFPHERAVVTLGEGSTPLVPAPRLAERIGLPPTLRLWLKIEAANPTGSFKDRGMTVAVSRAVDAGVRTVVCASTGNTAASAAAYAARAGIACVVLVPAGGVAAGKFAQVAAFGARILEIEGNFDAALRGAIELCRRRPDLRLVNSVNPDRIDGQRTAAFEICDQLGAVPAAVLLPVGNAGNITAYWRGFCDYHAAGKVSSRPRLFGVQAEGAAALVEDRDIAEPRTIASAIRIGRPASREGAVRAVRESDGAFWAVSDEALQKARDALGALEGVYV